MRGDVASVFAGHADWAVQQGDAIEFVRSLSDNSVDMLLTSPPYEQRRRYKLGVKLPRGEAWVKWMVEFVTAAVPKVRGPIFIVCEGETKDFSWSATPMLLAADLKRAGFTLRKPPIYKRHGVFGGGGPDWLRNDYETVLAITRSGKLRWSDNTACGRPPKYKPGGDPSHRKANGQRVSGKAYKPPAIANPGNVIDCGAGGKGHMGHALAHEHEAPFPLKLSDFLVRSFARPGGVVCDPFLGSGTTLHSCVIHGRRFVGCDLSQEYVDLSVRRAREVELEMRSQSEVAGGRAECGGGHSAAPVGEPGGAVRAAVGGG